MRFRSFILIGLLMFTLGDSITSRAGRYSDALPIFRLPSPDIPLEAIGLTQPEPMIRKTSLCLNPAIIQEGLTNAVLQHPAAEPGLLERSSTRCFVSRMASGISNDHKSQNSAVLGEIEAILADPFFNLDFMQNSCAYDLIHVLALNADLLPTRDFALALSHHPRISPEWIRQGFLYNLFAFLTELELDGQRQSSDHAHFYARDIYHNLAGALLLNPEFRPEWIQDNASRRTLIRLFQSMIEEWTFRRDLGIVLMADYYSSLLSNPGFEPNQVNRLFVRKVTYSLTGADPMLLGQLLANPRFRCAWLTEAASASGFKRAYSLLEDFKSKLLEKLGGTSSRDQVTSVDLFLVDTFLTSLRQSASNPDWESCAAAIQRQAGSELDLVDDFMAVNHSPLDRLDAPDRLEPSRLRAVGQGEAIVLVPGGRTWGLSTTDAENCAIVAVIATSPGSPASTRIGLAHLDPMTNPDRFEDFLRRAATTPEETRIHLVSGAGLLGPRVYAACRRYGQVAFINCDVAGDRADALTVSRNGRSYYGKPPSATARPEIAATDAARSRLARTRRQFTGEAYPLDLTFRTCN